MARRLTDGQRAAVRAAIARRGELELSQKGLAKAAGVSERTVSMFETFKTWPQADTLARIERMGLNWYVGYLNEYAARRDQAQATEDSDRDIADIMDSNLHPDLKLRLVDTLRQIRAEHDNTPERLKRPESDVG